MGRAAMGAKMAAVGYAASLPITEERSLFEFETLMPRPGERDLLVRVKAVSVNPVDVKVRMRKQGTDAQPVIRPAAHHHYGLGGAVRPDRRKARCRSRAPLAAGRWWRGRRRLDRH